MIMSAEYTVHFMDFVSFTLKLFLVWGLAVWFGIWFVCGAVSNMLFRNVVVAVVQSLHGNAVMAGLVLLGGPFRSGISCFWDSRASHQHTSRGSSTG